MDIAKAEFVAKAPGPLAKTDRLDVDLFTLHAGKHAPRAPSSAVIKVSLNYDERRTPSFSAECVIQRPGCESLCADAVRICSPSRRLSSARRLLPWRTPIALPPEAAIMAQLLIDEAWSVHTSSH